MSVDTVVTMFALILLLALYTRRLFVYDGGLPLNHHLKISTNVIDASDQYQITDRNKRSVCWL